MSVLLLMCPKCLAENLTHGGCPLNSYQRFKFVPISWTHSAAHQVLFRDSARFWRSLEHSQKLIYGEGPLLRIPLWVSYLALNFHSRLQDSEYLHIVTNLLNAQKTFFVGWGDWVLNRLSRRHCTLSLKGKKKKKERNILLGKVLSIFSPKAKAWLKWLLRDVCVVMAVIPGDSCPLFHTRPCKALCMLLIESSYPFLGDWVVFHIFRWTCWVLERD